MVDFADLNVRVTQTGAPEVTQQLTQLRAAGTGADNSLDSIGKTATKTAVPMRAVNELLKVGGMQLGIFGREGFMAAQALTHITEAMERAKTATAAATAATAVQVETESAIATVMGASAEATTAETAALTANTAAKVANTGATLTLRGVLGSISPVLVAILAGYAAFEATTQILDHFAKKQEEANDRLADHREIMQSLAAVHATFAQGLRKASEALEDADARLRAFTHGGEEGLRVTTQQQAVYERARSIFDSLAKGNDALTKSEALQVPFMKELIALFTSAATAVTTLTKAQQVAAAVNAMEDDARKTRSAQLQANADAWTATVGVIDQFTASAENAAHPMDALTRKFFEATQAALTLGRGLEQVLAAQGDLLAKTSSEESKTIMGAAIDAESARLAGVVADEKRAAANAVREMHEEERKALTTAQDHATAIQAAVAGALQLVEAFGRADQRLIAMVQNVTQVAANIGPLITALNQGAGSNALSSGLGIVSGISGIIGSFANAAEQARQEALQMQEAAKAWNASLDSMVKHTRDSGSQIRTTLDDLQDTYDQQRADLVAIFGHIQTLATHNKYMEALNKLNDWFTHAADGITQAYRDALGDRLLQARSDAGDPLAAAELLRVQRERELAAALTDSDRATLEQIYHFEDMAKAAKDAANAMQQLSDKIADTQRVIDTLQQYSSHLLLGNQTILSPARQLEEARRQFEAMAALANAGDKTAAQSLPGAGDALLAASRAYNASGLGYVADFQNVQRTISAITDKYGAQLTVEQQMLTELQRQTAIMSGQMPVGRPFTPIDPSKIPTPVIPGGKGGPITTTTTTTPTGDTGGVTPIVEALDQVKQVLVAIAMQGSDDSHAVQTAVESLTAEVRRLPEAMPV